MVMTILEGLFKESRTPSFILFQRLPLLAFALPESASLQIGTKVTISVWSATLLAADVQPGHASDCDRGLRNRFSKWTAPSIPKRDTITEKMIIDVSQDQHLCRVWNRADRG